MSMYIDREFKAAKIMPEGFKSHDTVVEKRFEYHALVLFYRVHANL